MKKYLAVAGIASVIGVAGLTGVGVVNAAANSSTSTDPMSSLVDALASKFNLNKSDVQSVFDAQRTKMEADHEATIKAEVAQLVTDGKITQDQADKINAKRAEIQKQREADRASNQSLTHEQRKAKRDQERTDLETWAKNNGIDTQYLRYVMGGHGHHGMGDRGDMMKDDTNNSSSTSGSSSTN